MVPFTVLMHCTNMTELKLSGNELTALPPELGWCTQLRSMKMNSNNIATLPEEGLVLLTMLQNLSLRGNSFSVLPCNFGYLR
jgi:Leucine-rich repeat (LRR) protein